MQLFLDFKAFNYVLKLFKGSLTCSMSFIYKPVSVSRGKNLQSLSQIDIVSRRLDAINGFEGMISKFTLFNLSDSSGEQSLPLHALSPFPRALLSYLIPMP